MINTSNFVNHFEMTERTMNFLDQGLSPFACRDIRDLGHHQVSYLHNILPSYLINTLLTETRCNEWLAVGKDGFSNKAFDKVGNYRLSNWNPKLADVIWSNIKNLFPSTFLFDEMSPVDYDNHPEWKPVGINPLMRFIQYRDGGELVTHYDAPFIQDEKTRSLMTLVIYLSDNETGATRFIKDPQIDKPQREYDYSDWTSPARDDQVIIAIKPRKCGALMFGHRILHDSQPVINETKTIIRTDIMFRKV